MPAYSGDKKSCYAYAPGDNKSDWKLPLCNTSGELDAGIIGAAKAAFGKGFRGNKVSLPTSARAGVRAKINAAAKKVGSDPIKSGEFLNFTESQLWLAESSPTGFLVALWVDPDTAAELAVPGGETPDSLHITLAYCGEADELDELVQARVITAIDEIVHYRNPLEGEVAGYGRFISKDEEDDPKDVFYASPDLPGLAELRQCIVDCLMDKGVMVSTNHGYIPHITLAYLDPGEANPLSEIEDTPLTFKAVTVMSGTRRVDVPFWDPGEQPSYMMSETGELPLDAPLDAKLARALYFGSFDKEWIPFLPKPGKYVHEVYGPMDFTSETYSQILRNFDNYVYKQDLPIRATHTAPEAGAVGWIKPGGMRLAGDGSIEVRPEWNELGKGLVQDDRFKYASAEFCRIWTNPVTQEKIQNVAVGLALVTRPHFKTDVLNPLSEAEALAFAETTSTEENKSSESKPAADGGEGTTMSDSQKAQADATTSAAAAGDAAKAADADSKVQADASAAGGTAKTTNPLDSNQSLVLSDLTQVVITAEQRRAERQLFTDLTTRVELAERRASTAEAKLAVAEKQRREEKFTAEVLGRSAENGQPWFGDPKANIAHLVSLAEQYGEDSTEVRWAVTQKRNEAAAIRNTGIFDPISIGGTEEGASVNAQVARLAEQLKSTDANLTTEQAISKAYEDNPDLYVRSLKK